MATQTGKMFTVKTLNHVFLLGVLVVTAACGSDDSGRSKRNSKNLYRIDITSRSCNGVRLQKTFTSQRDACEYLEYEARSNNCLYSELNQEYARFNCQAGYHNGYDSGVYNPQLPNSGELPVNIPPPPHDPTITVSPRDQATYWNDLNDSLNALNSYYTIDNSGCLASIKGTTDVIDLCVDARPSGPRPGEKDGVYIPDTYTREKDAPYTPEKDGEYEARPSRPSQPATKPTPAPSTPPVAGVESPTPTTPSEDTGNKSAYNLVTFNARSLLPQEVNRIPVLKITGIIDSASPIYNLRHSAPSDIKAIQLSNVTTQCPMRAQLTTSGSSAVLTLLVESGSTDAQVQACRAFFNDFASVSSFEFGFKEPLRMSNGTSINQPFKFVNK